MEVVSLLVPFLAAQDAVEPITRLLSALTTPALRWADDGAGRYVRGAADGSSPGFTISQGSVGEMFLANTPHFSLLAAMQTGIHVICALLYLQGEVLTVSAPLTAPHVLRGLAYVAVHAAMAAWIYAIRRRTLVIWKAVQAERASHRPGPPSEESCRRTLVAMTPWITGMTRSKVLAALMVAEVVLLCGTLLESCSAGPPAALLPASSEVAVLTASGSSSSSSSSSGSSSNNTAAGAMLQAGAFLYPHCPKLQEALARGDGKISAASMEGLLRGIVGTRFLDWRGLGFGRCAGPEDVMVQALLSLGTAFITTIALLEYVSSLWQALGLLLVTAAIAQWTSLSLGRGAIAANAARMAAAAAADSGVSGGDGCTSWGGAWSSSSIFSRSHGLVEVYREGDVVPWRPFGLLLGPWLTQLAEALASFGRIGALPAGGGVATDASANASTATAAVNATEDAAASAAPPSATTTTTTVLYPVASSWSVCHAGVFFLMNYVWRFAVSLRVLELHSHFRELVHAKRLAWRVAAAEARKHNREVEALETNMEKASLEIAESVIRRITRPVRESIHVIGELVREMAASAAGSPGLGLGLGQGLPADGSGGPGASSYFYHSGGVLTPSMTAAARTSPFPSFGGRAGGRGSSRLRIGTPGGGAGGRDASPALPLPPPSLPRGSVAAQQQPGESSAEARGSARGSGRGGGGQSPHRWWGEGGGGAGGGSTPEPVPQLLGAGSAAATPLHAALAQERRRWSLPHPAPPPPPPPQAPSAGAATPEPPPATPHTQDVADILAEIDKIRNVFSLWVSTDTLLAMKDMLTAAATQARAEAETASQGAASSAEEEEGEGEEEGEEAARGTGSERRIRPSKRMPTPGGRVATPLESIAAGLGQLDVSAGGGGGSGDVHRTAGAPAPPQRSPLTSPATGTPPFASPITGPPSPPTSGVAATLQLRVGHEGASPAPAHSPFPSPVAAAAPGAAARGGGLPPPPPIYVTAEAHALPRPTATPAVQVAVGAAADPEAVALRGEQEAEEGEPAAAAEGGGGGGGGTALLSLSDSPATAVTTASMLSTVTHADAASPTTSTGSTSGSSPSTATTISTVTSPPRPPPLPSAAAQQARPRLQTVSNGGGESSGHAPGYVSSGTSGPSSGEGGGGSGGRGGGSSTEAQVPLPAEQAGLPPPPTQLQQKTVAQPAVTTLGSTPLLLPATEDGAIGAPPPPASLPHSLPAAAATNGNGLVGGSPLHPPEHRARLASAAAPRWPHVASGEGGEGVSGEGAASATATASTTAAGSVPPAAPRVLGRRRGRDDSNVPRLLVPEVSLQRVLSPPPGGSGAGEGGGGGEGVAAPPLPPSAAPKPQLPTAPTSALRTALPTPPAPGSGGSARASTAAPAPPPASAPGLPRRPYFGGATPHALASPMFGLYEVGHEYEYRRGSGRGSGGGGGGGSGSMLGREGSSGALAGLLLPAASPPPPPPPSASLLPPLPVAGIVAPAPLPSAPIAAAAAAAAGATAVAPVAPVMAQPPPPPPAAPPAQAHLRLPGQVLQPILLPPVPLEGINEVATEADTTVSGSSSAEDGDGVAAAARRGARRTVQPPPPAAPTPAMMLQAPFLRPSPSSASSSSGSSYSSDGSSAPAPPLAAGATAGTPSPVPEVTQTWVPGTTPAVSLAERPVAIPAVAAPVGGGGAAGTPSRPLLSGHTAVGRLIVAVGGIPEATFVSPSSESSHTTAPALQVAAGAFGGGNGAGSGGGGALLVEKAPTSSSATSSSLVSSSYLASVSGAVTSSAGSPIQRVSSPAHTPSRPPAPAAAAVAAPAPAPAAPPALPPHAPPPAPAPPLERYLGPLGTPSGPRGTTQPQPPPRVTAPRGSAVVNGTVATSTVTSDSSSNGSGGSRSGTTTSTPSGSRDGGPPSTSATTTAPASSSSTSALGRYRFGLHVLVVDDEAINRKIVGRMLDRLGCTHEECEDGDQVGGALLSSAVPFDIILLDVLMKRTHGWAVCQELRAQGVTIPIVAATAAYAPAEAPLYRRAGFTRVLSKPFDQRELAGVLAAALGARLGGVSGGGAGGGGAGIPL